MLMIEMSNNVMSAHISQFPVGTYKKAHRHGAGAHVIILKGEGFSRGVARGRRYQTAATGAPAGLLVPPERWFHQHFNIGGEPARYLALKPFSSRKFPGLRKQWGTSESVKNGGDQIEYEDESQRIRQMFEAELAKRGVAKPNGQCLQGGELTVNIVTRKLCCLLIGCIAICAPNSPVDAADKVRISVTNPNMSFLPSGVAFKKVFQRRRPST